MVGQIDFQRPLLTAGYFARQTIRAQWRWLVFIAVTAGLSGLMLMGPDANPGIIAWVIYLAGVIAIFRQPRYGVYLIVFFSLMADKSLMIWYPFVGNMSSKESLMYLDKSVIVSPLEVYLILTVISWLLHRWGQRKLLFNAGFMTGPVILWSAFMAFGLFTGLTHGGNSNIGLWESRAMFYLPVMVILASNVFETREQLNRLLWFSVIAIFIMGGLMGVYTFIFVLHGSASRIESIVEHAAAVRMNILYVFAIGAFMFKGSKLKRIVLPLMCPLVLITYMVSQRRAAYIAFALGIIMIFVVMFILNRRMFLRIAPVVAILAIGYLGAFWNNSGTLGLPARAIKSMISSSGGSAQENSSNEYRVIENMNDIFTVKQSPLTGVGFGHVFYITVQMPDISFFAWWQYIVHNSIIYIWMKTGIGGFASMLFMVATALILGVRVLLKMSTLNQMPGGDMSAIALVAVLYIFMHFVYAYVDMSWDNQSMVYIGTMMGVLNCMEQIAAKPVAMPARRRLKVWNPVGEHNLEVEVNF